MPCSPTPTSPRLRPAPRPARSRASAAVERVAGGTDETLIRLGRSPGRQLRQVELSRQLSLTTGGVTRMVDRLEAAGLVRRTPCPDDRRAS
jgi:uncharacterized membrane protein